MICQRYRFFALLQNNILIPFSARTILSTSNQLFSPTVKMSRNKSSHEPYEYVPNPTFRLRPDGPLVHGDSVTNLQCNEVLTKQYREKMPRIELARERTIEISPIYALRQDGEDGVRSKVLYYILDAVHTSILGRLIDVKRFLGVKDGYTAADSL